MKEKDFDILVVDDEQIIIDAVFKVASIANMKTDAADNAEDAVRKLVKNSYRLIISDIMMPVMDGFQFLKMLEEKNIDTPVIMTTGYTTFENAAKSVFLGALDYLPKPFTVDELMGIIRRGMKYSEIMQTSGNPTSFVVPCPHKYYRFGKSVWINIQTNEELIIGASDLYIKTVENLLEIELLEMNGKLIQGEICARFKSSDGSTYSPQSPVSGEIIQRNERLLSEPTLLEKDPYFSGWIYKIKPSDLKNDLEYLTPCSSDRL